METVKCQENRSVSNELKERMERISIAFENFDLEGFREQILAVRNLSQQIQKTELFVFCSEFLKDMENEGFSGIYRKIQSFISLVTDIINEIDSAMEN
ncbi:MAG: hypothetical protein PUF12_01470 [Thermoflexaceae bacterium]|nr:hypothetical protein [Thermoflexaceae bacterium]